MTDVLLCGGTGDLGGRIARRLAERGVRFRALVRPTSDPAPLRALGAEIAVGDLTDPASLAGAVEGVHTVVTTVNSMARALAGDKTVSFETVDRDGNANLVAAAGSAGVERFVFVSAEGFSGARMAASPFASAKLATERLLTASRMRSVIVRPAPFQEIWLGPLSRLDPARRRAMIFGRGRSRIAFVSEDDVAEACVRLATMDDPPASLDFGGPEVLTRREAVEAYERATGKKFTKIVVPRPVLATGARLLPRFRPAVAAMLGMSLAMDVEGSTPSAQPLRDLGIEPRPASEYIAGAARQAVAA